MEQMDHSSETMEPKIPNGQRGFSMGWNLSEIAIKSNFWYKIGQLSGMIHIFKKIHIQDK